MESYKIEVSTPKTPRISTLVQNVEQQMAILLRGKQKGQKSHEIAKKKKKNPVQSGKDFWEGFGKSFEYHNVSKPEGTVPNGTCLWRDTPIQPKYWNKGML